MASVSLSISTEFDSAIEVGELGGPQDTCISVVIRTFITPDHVYAADWLVIHGDQAAMRKFAGGIIAALDKAATRNEAEPLEVSA